MSHKDNYRDCYDFKVSYPLLRVYLPNNRYQCKSGVELGLSKTDFEVVSDIKKCEFIFSYTHIEFCLDKVCYLIE